ncbi:MAG: macro domain-containing protein [bacterium]
MTSSVLAIEPVEKKIYGKTLRLMKGDLTALSVDAFVFYARENLDIGTGYGTAIQMRGGVAIKKELEGIGGIRMGEAVASGAGEMNANLIIHACGPKHLEKDTETKLRKCMKSSLEVAKEKGVKTLAFPPMGTGFYGVPMPLSSKVMMETITEHLRGNTSIEEVTICTVDDRDFNAFKGTFEKI